MPWGIASAKQLAMINKVLDEYCQANSIDIGERRDDVATFLLQRFNEGSRSPKELETALARYLAKR